MTCPVPLQVKKRSESTNVKSILFLISGKINSVRLCHLKASPDLTPSFILLGRQFTGIIDAVNDGLFHMKERHMSTRNPGKTRVTERY